MQQVLCADLPAHLGDVRWQSGYGPLPPTRASSPASVRGMNSVPVNSASSFYGSPRSLGLEEVEVQHRLWFVLQVPVSSCSAPFHIQLFFPIASSANLQ